jgi:hypothetical protein
MERHVHKEHRHPLFKKTKSSRSGQNSRNSWKPTNLQMNRRLVYIQNTLSYYC